MIAVVTGGAGFIGSTLADALLARGDEVHVIDDLSRGHRGQVPAAARFHRRDILDERCPALLAEIRPDIVFHQAAQIDVRRSVADPVLDTRINVLGTVKLLEACVRGGVRRMVFASSGGAMYGDTTRIPTPEDEHCEPASAYGAAKLAGEIYGGVFARLHDLEFVALRYANVYGPRQDPHGEAGVVAIFAERLLQDRPAVINGDGRQTRDYIHVDDVVAANLAAATTRSLRPYNIGTGRECDVNRLYQLIATAVGVDADAEHAPAREGEQRRSCLDIDLAEQQLRWHPTISLEEGISGTVAWFREHGELL